MMTPTKKPEPNLPSLDDVLRRMLATPPQPKKAHQEPKKKLAKK
jgi:hypothetical protein